MGCQAWTGDLNKYRNAGSICGNGRVDPGETCDTAIPTGAPGACPSASCDDGAPCTIDRASGAGCTLLCLHTEITAPLGHYVVLGVAPTRDGTSVFVVQVTRPDTGKPAKP